MTWTAFLRNVLFAVILLLLVATLQEARLPFTQRVEEYLAFVLTTDFDYQPWLDYLQSQLALPDLSWLPGLGGSPGSPADGFSR